MTNQERLSLYETPIDELVENEEYQELNRLEVEVKQELREEAERWEVITK